MAIYKNGKIDASGWHNMHPKKYGEGVRALTNYFEGLLTQFINLAETEEDVWAP